MALILVYVGAVMVLFLFVVMMLDIDVGPLRRGLVRYLPVGLLVAVVMLVEILLLIGIHLFMVVVHKHTQYPGPGRTEDNVVGFPVGPVYAAKAGGFFFIVFGVLALIASTVTINANWNYGPYDPSPVQAGTQPDWYIGVFDGALRLMPGMIGDLSNRGRLSVEPTVQVELSDLIDRNYLDRQSLGQ